jgi:hypothetical protein
MGIEEGFSKLLGHDFEKEIPSPGCFALKETVVGRG